MIKSSWKWGIAISPTYAENSSPLMTEEAFAFFGRYMYRMMNLYFSIKKRLNGQQWSTHIPPLCLNPKLSKVPPTVH